MDQGNRRRNRQQRRRNARRAQSQPPPQPQTRQQLQHLQVEQELEQSRRHEQQQMQAYERQRNQQQMEKEQEFLRIQQTDLNQPKLVLSAEELEVEYVKMLGVDYRKRPIFDVIMNDDTFIGDYIDEDTDNLVFFVDGLSFTGSRNSLVSTMPLYECTNENSMASFTDGKFISLTNLGCPCVGVASYDAFKQVIINTNYQIFQLRDSKRKTKTLASHRTRYLGGLYVSDAHCQTGTASTYYELYVPEKAQALAAIPVTSYREQSAQEQLLRLARKGTLSARIHYICLLYPPLDEMRDWFTNQELAKYTVVRLGLPYAHSTVKMQYHSLATDAAREIYNNPLSIQKTPFVKQKSAVALSDAAYVRLMSWFGEICSENDAAHGKWTVHDCIRMIYITNDYIANRAVPRAEWQLVAAAAAMIVSSIHGHNDTKYADIAESTIAYAAANTYTTKQILEMMASICERCPYVMYMELPFRIPNTIRQYNIYTKDFIDNGEAAFDKDVMLPSDYEGGVLRI